MGVYVKICVCFLMVIGSLHGDIENIGGDDVDIREFNQDLLFISLGSYCAPASLVRSCGHRKAAFPFDWNIAMDVDKLIEVLNSDFSEFLNDEYLQPFGWATLLNTHYHLEFVHDGSWDGGNPSIYMPILLSKYSRRIKRFRELKQHQGKIYFLRSAYIHSLDDLNRFYKVEANIEITEENALKLHDALKSYFPDVDLCLVIFNNHPHEYLEMEKNIDGKILMLRGGPYYEKPVMEGAYCNFFDTLIQETPIVSGLKF